MKIVSVDPAPALTTVEPRVAPSPIGDDVALRLIASAVPVTTVVLIVMTGPGLAPWTAVRLLGLAEMAKSEGAGVRITVTEVPCEAGPSVPVTITV